MRLLVTDFDGTIAEIGPNAQMISISPVAERFLQSLALRSDVAVAIVSGRDIQDLSRRTANVRAFRAGSHGLELLSPDGETLITCDRVLPAVPSDIQSRASPAGMTLERKRHGVALHWRGAPHLADGTGAAIVEEFRRWADQEGLDLLEGRMVVEARLRGPMKRDVLVDLAGRVGATRVFYCGDDFTDFAALEWASERGIGVLVASDERRERPRGCAVVHTLEELIDQMRQFVK